MPGQRIAALVAVIPLQACAASVSCPPVQGESRTAMLLNHGDHASLAIEHDGGVMLRYSYGDRRWYGEADTGLRSGAAALLTRSDAVLSRLELAAAPTIDAVEHALHLVVSDGYAFDVEADRARRLIEKLDAIFFDDPGAQFYNPAYRLEFAPHPEPYSAANTSNHVLAGWLDELGCTSGGNHMFSIWRVTASAARPQ